VEYQFGHRQVFFLVPTAHVINGAWLTMIQDLLYPGVMIIDGNPITPVSCFIVVVMGSNK
jgi:hypothetical protein